ncbi:MAG TPA: hypothetical protein VLB47_07400 [Solirubrobacteraceae bacterium]|nr:hypothetical protein [Solirubrobacteraceae bacterium]
MTGAGDATGRLDVLRAEARYARERLDLYRARAYGLRPVRESRLRELERAAQAAEERYRRALDAADAGPV